MEAYHKPAIVSLPLQVALYYNLVLSVLFATVVGACSVQKMLFYNKLVSISVIVIWTAIEPLRLFIGLRGNMKEKVPDISTHLLISVFPQLPLVIYLAYFQPVLFPVDPILGTFMIVFIVVEFIFGIALVRKQIKLQTTEFISSTSTLGLELSE